MVKTQKKWKYIPINDEILLNLLNQENRGEMLTTDLYRKLKIANKDLSYSDLMSKLFNLEVRGFIYVIPIKKSVFKIEITKDASLSHEIRERVRNYIH